VNLEGHSIRSHEDVEHVRRAVEGKLAPLTRKVYAIVNYDNFEIFPDIIDEYSSMVQGLVDVSIPASPAIRPAASFVSS
jgi:propionate CoA-transferase